MAGLQKLEAELRQEVRVLLGLHIDSRPLNKVCLVINRHAEVKSYISAPKQAKLLFCLQAKSIRHLNSCKSDKGSNEKSQKSEESGRNTLASSVLLHYIRLLLLKRQHHLQDVLQAF